MQITANTLLTAFSDSTIITHGTMSEITPVVREYQAKNNNPLILIFDDNTGNQVEIDIKVAGPGRPKLGVVSREVSLLPRHWDWLGLQPNGASAALRRLIEATMKHDHPKVKIRQSQEATHKFMTALAGNLPHYEEALRALYAKDQNLFKSATSSWPKDIRAYTKTLSTTFFDDAA